MPLDKEGSLEATQQLDAKESPCENLQELIESLNSNEGSEEAHFEDAIAPKLTTEHALDVIQTCEPFEGHDACLREDELPLVLAMESVSLDNQQPSAPAEVEQPVSCELLLDQSPEAPTVD